MKKIINFLVFSLLALLANAQPEPAKQMAERIAVRMKDTLGLTEQQKQQVYDMNILLFNQKAVVRQEHKGSAQLSTLLQKVENTRDSLYQVVLPREKYFLYKEKKKNLVHNNPVPGQ